MSPSDSPLTGGPAVSLVVVAHNMQRELPRTLYSLSPRTQQGVEAGEYEVIVVDNGSSPAVPSSSEPWLTVMRIANATVSPAPAVNLGIAAASADLIGVLIDGARIASPGLVRHARIASLLHPRVIVATLGFHLGPDVQMLSVNSGYTRELEDKLLEESGWEQDGYRLFAISTFAGSSADGWFMPLAESNALFMRRELWNELGGFDVRFRARGGGLVNLDTYERACSLPDSQLAMLLGEGTFHQVHGGVATNAVKSPWDEFHDEYVAIRGRPFVRPRVDTLYVGRLHPAVAASLVASSRRLEDQAR